MAYSWFVIGNLKDKLTPKSGMKIARELRSGFVVKEFNGPPFFIRAGDEDNQGADYRERVCCCRTLWCTATLSW